MNRQLREKTLLITGGAGFIGSNLCRHFLALNKVICLDNLSTGFRRNIDPFINHPNFKFIEGDIRDAALCDRIINPEIDFVLHHAALGSVSRSITDPFPTHDNNVTGFLTVLNSVKKAKSVRLIFASSSSVYGDCAEFPMLEDRTGKPLSPYAVSKIANELYAKVFSSAYGTEIIGLRYFNVFGSNQDPNGPYAAVIPKFISQFIKKQPVTVNGTGEQTRDFTYIENVLHANEMACLATSREALNEVYNVAYGHRTSLLELIEHIRTMLLELGKSTNPGEIVHQESRPGDLPDSFADISKIKRLLGYHPQIDLKEGIRKYIQDNY